MKILHTSDWHLGKYLEKYSRIEEQILFIDELEKICEQQNIDLIIIAGDIYDTTNPPILAEKLFFDAMKRLSLNGSRPIIIISGNHDSSSKLSAPTPLTTEFAVFIQTDFDSIVPIGQYNNFKITDSGKAFLEIEINNERASIITIPYITEKLLNQVIFNELEEDLQQKEFSSTVKQILADLTQNFTEESINIIIMHLFVKNSIESDSERKIQVGGAYAIDTSIFPEKTQYVALGHLHRMQEVKNDNCKVYYAGSPIRYSQSEVGYEKSVIVLDIKPKRDPIISKIPLTDYKPIHVLKCNGYEEALDKLDAIQDENCYVFIDIFTKIAISTSQINYLKKTSKDIVNIVIKVEGEEFYTLDKELEEDIDIAEQFKQFYLDKRAIEPSKELVEQFFSILEELEYGEDK